MRKLLLICSAVSLIYGNCVWGIDYDENELYENPWSDSNLDPLKENFDKNDEKQANSPKSSSRLTRQLSKLNELNSKSITSPKIRQLEQSEQEIEDLKQQIEERDSYTEHLIHEMQFAKKDKSLEQQTRELNQQLFAANQREQTYKSKIRELSELLKNVKQQLSEMTQRFEEEQELRKQAEEEIKKLQQRLEIVKLGNKIQKIDKDKNEYQMLIKYAPAMGQLDVIAGAKPSTPPQDSKALLKRFAEVLEVDESMLRYEDRLGQVRLIDISNLIGASLLNSDLNGQLIQTFMNSCSKKLVSIGIDPHWLSKPSNDQSAKAFNWIRSQVNKGIREYKFDTSQRALAKRKLIAARPWNDNSEITEKSITEVINKVTNQLQPPDPKYIRYAKALGLLEAIAGAKPSTPPPSDKSLLKRFADILGIDVNLLICDTDYYKSGICFRNMEEQIIVNRTTSTSDDEIISTLYNNYSRELAKVGIYTIHYGVPSKEAFNVLCSQAKQGITGYKFDTSPEAMEKRRAIALRPWDNI